MSYVISENLDIVKVEPRSMSKIESTLIRSLDCFISLLMLMVLSPLLFLLLILIRLDSKGPAIFAQRRVGLNNVPFTMYKFRTMYQGAEANAPDISDLDEPNIQLRTDDPYTRIGKLMSSRSVDEIPQLINVLKGEMSLVGPRPLIQAEVDCFPESWKQRFQVLPGLTGWAQISSRELPVAEQIQMDLEWVQKQGVRVYLKLIIATVIDILY
ncbi:MAG: sugar transferase [Candidatus Scalindua sp. AMX11]|nr:MAG: sugar transferase [Candidatus Scalindua sp.]NOG82979.1 sugar transferase [Planctomycetota bacterium]RZV68047.1 MAG: sugar transferase [Candidatus Scalindua sp. SCAELEC01]TDE63738.1 MAG: sugar transferase [Candidatus Scalindua sp. AMX11]GJQ60478.1 MAG: sugar transferase [Candidatus Scalindua sp.]